MSNKLAMDVLQSAYEQYSKAVFSTAFQLTGSQTEADDIMQDVFIKMYKELDKGSYIKNIKNWLYRVTTTTAIDMFKKRKTVNLSETVMESFSAKLQDNDVTELLHALKELRQDERLSIILFYLHDFTHNEIADLTGHSIEKIKIDLYRGREQLRKIFLKEKITNE